MRRALLVAVALLAAPASAGAFFAPGATVVSASPERGELADDASQVAGVSADGRYAVFQTRATNFFADDDPDPPGTDRLGGVFRRNLQTGALELVAPGDLVAEDGGTLQRIGARNPSISADGRLVAFSTAYAHVPQDSNDAIDVYVRDMGVAAAAPGAFVLVSARNGSDVPAAYAGTESTPAGQRLGAEIWPLTSISADGTRVVFRATAQSDLPGAASATVAAGQLLVRDTAARTTRLVTRAAADGAPAGGAAGPATLSADGTAVVWTGANARPQTPFLSGEPYDTVDNFYLWQRLADGPAAPTRRITGLVDLDDPGCAPGSTIVNDPSATGPCYGALTTTDGGGSSIAGRQIGLSGDGYRVWFLTPGYRRPSPLFSSVFDVFSTDMRSGLPRKSATLELTREGAPDDAAAAGAVDGVAVSPDGRWLALATARTKFAGGRLALTGPARAVPDLRELYLADLSSNTLERVLTGFDGGDAAGGGVGSQVAISAAGDRVAFTSGGSNLFFGDANNRPDAFVVTRTDPPAAEAPPPPQDETNQDIEDVPPPADPPSLAVRVRRGPKRSVVLAITVPAAGKLAVRARGRLPGAGGKRRPLRTFATARGTARRAQTVRLTLRVVKRFDRALRRYRRLRAAARITFKPAAPGRALLAGATVRLRPQPRRRGGK